MTHLYAVFPFSIACATVSLPNEIITEFQNAVINIIQIIQIFKYYSKPSNKKSTKAPVLQSHSQVQVLPIHKVGSWAENASFLLLLSFLFISFYISLFPELSSCHRSASKKSAPN